MIEGNVEDLQACVQVLVRSPYKNDLTIEFIVDTGFEGALTLPPDTVEALGLPFFEPMDANLANDSTVIIDAHVGIIDWDGSELDVLVLATGSRPLLGTSLLSGMRMCADFNDGGLVRIESLS